MSTQVAYMEKQTLKRNQSSSNVQNMLQMFSKMALLNLMEKALKKNQGSSGQSETGVLSTNMALELPQHKPSLPMTAAPNQPLQLVPKEQLPPGDRVFYPGDRVWHHGIWDGDAVIHIKRPRCNCADCVAAAKFNNINAPRFERGDHLHTPCEVNKLGKPMYHQGIYDGKGYVYHFANSKVSTDRDYEKCAECRVRGVHRRENLSLRGLGPSGVRKSCLSCFSEGETIDRVKYQAKFIERIRSKVPGSVSMRKSRPAEMVVNEAKTFYENDSFGEYSYDTYGVSHNCESFAYYCKTGVYGAKQVTHGLLDVIMEHEIIDPWLDLLLVIGAKAFFFVEGNQKILKARERAENANKAHPQLVPAALVPAKLYKVDHTKAVRPQATLAMLDCLKCVCPLL